jgi:hypothetical protein
MLRSPRALAPEDLLDELEDEAYEFNDYYNMPVWAYSTDTLAKIKVKRQGYESRISRFKKIVREQVLQYNIVVELEESVVNGYDPPLV